VAKLNDDQRRALQTLAHQDGCAEAMLLADGFSIDQLTGLVIEGYAVMQRRRVRISRRMRTVVWMQITEKGRMAIAAASVHAHSLMSYISVCAPPGAANPDRPGSATMARRG
jgi:hypothetical protein